MEIPQETQILQPAVAAAEIEITRAEIPDRLPRTTGSTGGVFSGCATCLSPRLFRCSSLLFLYQPVRVEGTSMLPRLEDHDRLFINKFVYHIESIERGDVVVFHYPLDPEKSYIKRVIALPGDRLRIDHGQRLGQWQPLAEGYVPEKYRDSVR